MDSVGIQKQVEDLAAKGLIGQDEAQNTKDDESACGSREGKQMKEVIKEKKAPGSSRTRKKLAWMVDYVMS